MGCKNSIDPREVLRRIIRNIIQRNLRILENQVKLLKTYDLAVWEGVARGFIRAISFIKLGKRVLRNSRFEDEMNEMLLNMYRRALNVAYKGKNPSHRAKALAKIARAGIHVGYSKVYNILDEAVKNLEAITDDVERIKVASYVLFEISRILSGVQRDRKMLKVSDETLGKIEEIAQSVYKRAISWISVLNSPAEKARCLAYLAEGIRDLSIVVKTDKYETKWLDVQEAEVLAKESLQEAELIDDPYSKGIVKTYVAYLYSTLSMDLRDSAERLYEDATEIALKLSKKDEKQAGELLGEIAFTKALIGLEDEAEALFHEACIIALQCPYVQNVLTALKIAELAGKGRLARILGELLEDYILPTIRSIREELSQIALIAIASDVAAWVDLGWGARLAMNAAEDLWMHMPEDIQNGEQIYLIALAAQKSAFAEPEAAWRIFDFLVSSLRSESWQLPLFVTHVSLEWIGKAYAVLKEIPAFYDIFKRELRIYLEELQKNTHRDIFVIGLIDLASGIGSSDKEFAIKLIERAMRLSQGRKIESVALGRIIKAAAKINDGLSEVYINEATKRAESLQEFEDIINYLTKILKELIPSEQSKKIAKIIVDIITEASTRDVVVSKSVKKFLKLLRRVDAAWANEIEELIKEEKRLPECGERRSSRNIICDEKP